MTDSEKHSDLVGKYIPVDIKGEKETVYIPSKLFFAFEDAESYYPTLQKVNENRNLNYERLVNTSVRFKFTRFDEDKEEWNGDLNSVPMYLSSMLKYKKIASVLTAVVLGIGTLGSVDLYFYFISFEPSRELYVIFILVFFVIVYGILSNISYLYRRDTPFELENR